MLLGCVKTLRSFGVSFVLAFIASIYPNPELSSKDSASVVCCSSMGVLLIIVCRVRMACDGICIRSLSGSQEPFKSEDNSYTREKPLRYHRKYTPVLHSGSRPGSFMSYATALPSSRMHRQSLCYFKKPWGNLIRFNAMVKIWSFEMS